MEIALNDYPEANVSAIRFELRNETLNPMSWADAIQSLFDSIRESAAEKGLVSSNGLCPIEIRMPCGIYRVYDDVSFLPVVTTSCPCGNPKHKLFEWVS